jgi:uncharacterized BrkB/YihY/UPF0761 family membrane protein
MAESVGSRVDALRDTLDRYQQQHRIPGFIYAVVKKYGDDEGGRHAALMAYYGLLSVFPLLLLIVSAISKILVNDPALRQNLVNAIVPPEFRDAVNQALAALPTSGLAWVIGIIGLIGAGLRIVTTAYDTVNHVAGIPFRDRVNGPMKYVRQFVILAVLLLGMTGIGAATVGAQFLPDAELLQRLGEFCGITLMTYLLIWAGISLLLPRRPPLAAIWPAALIGSLAIAALLSFGSTLLTRLIAREGPVYGSFATIFGLVAFIALITQALVWAAEVAVVSRLRLWPRGLDPNTPTSADKRALVILAREQERLPDQQNVAAFSP